MTLYYRVSNIFKNATVGIYEGERKLLGRKKIKLAPGEMETITLPAALIESIVGDTIRIGIEEDK
jgi:hypothetical protein